MTLFYLLQAITFTRDECAWKFQHFCFGSRQAYTDTVFIIAVITGAALSSFCRSLHCLEMLHACYWHDCWSFRAFLGVFGTLGCVFLGLRRKALLLTQESFNCTASWRHIFLTWWLLTQAQTDGHLFFSLWTFPLFCFQNLIKANFWDILYLSAILSSVACCSLHEAQRN